jgi:hypothetical protein
MESKAMDQEAFTSLPENIPVSPLVLSDRLIALAEAADRAGFLSVAARLVRLASTVLEVSRGMAH